MSDDWLLYTHEAGWGLPSLDPSSVQAYVYLHLAGVPLSVQECSLSRSAPTGVTPSLEHRGELIDAPAASPSAPADAAAAIIDYAKSQGADLDAWLSPAQRAEAAAFACLARAALEPASSFTTWCEPAAYEAAKAAYGADLPFPLSALLPRSARKAAERRFAGAGSGGGGGGVAAARERVYGEAAAAVAALADRLAASPGPWFFGDRPCGVDALLYAHLAFHRAAPVAAPELRAALDARPRLGAYVDAVAARLAALGPPPPRGGGGGGGGGPTTTDAEWAARAEAAQAEWRRAGAAGPRRGSGNGSRRASGGGGGGGGGRSPPSSAQKKMSAAKGNALWLGTVGALVGLYVLLSGQFVEFGFEELGAGGFEAGEGEAGDE